jgi:hypothetical protein
MLENYLKKALETAERHMSRARDQKDTPTEMIYAVVANKIRESLFEIQQNLNPVDDELPGDGTVLVL